jgi:hypothetical protein
MFDLHYLNQYYIDRSEDETKSKWNWGAFIFGPLWLFYRRMYAYGFLYFIIEGVLHYLLSWDKSVFAPFMLLIVIYPLVIHILLGCYGTRLFLDKYYVVEESSDKTEAIKLEDARLKTRPISAIFIYIIINIFTAFLISDNAASRITITDTSTNIEEVSIKTSTTNVEEVSITSTRTNEAVNTEVNLESTEKKTPDSISK